MKMLQYIIENKEWIFSGIGITGIVCLITFMRHIVIPGFGKYQLHKENTINKDNNTVDQSEYITETPPDGTKCIIGEPFIKTWTIRNIGHVIWKNRYLKCDPLPMYMHVKNEKVKMPKILPGQEYTLQVTFMIECEGVYRSYWKMYDENNNLSFPDLEGLGVTIIAERKRK